MVTIVKRKARFVIREPKIYGTKGQGSVGTVYQAWQPIIQLFGRLRAFVPVLPPLPHRGGYFVINQHNQDFPPFLALQRHNAEACKVTLMCHCFAWGQPQASLMLRSLPRYRRQSKLYQLARAVVLSTQVLNWLETVRSSSPCHCSARRNDMNLYVCYQWAKWRARFLVVMRS